MRSIKKSIFSDYTLQFLDRIRSIIQKNKLTKFLHQVDVTPFLQPVFCKDGKTLVGSEILLRLKYKEQYLSPSFIIHDLELSGLMDDITCCLLAKVVSCFGNNAEVLPQDFYFSINVHPAQLLSEKVVRSLTSFNNFFKGKTVLVVELVERSVDIDEQVGIIKALKSEGILFAIDDFGAGSTSLKYIQNTFFSFVKIDRSLTMSCDGKLIYNDIIDAIVSLSEVKGLSVTAEGIENMEQLDLLCKAGVDNMQGFYLARPMSIECFIRTFIFNSDYNHLSKII